MDLADEQVFEASFIDDPANAPASRYPGVIAELEKIRNKKGSWLSGAVILGVSVALFLGAGAARWDWHFALLLIPILLFHELGHFVAMRVFKYRNLKMFFIPLLGAAVTGQNYNVAGWKKAIVSLAGPVPGIVVGIGLGILAIALGDQPLLLEAATLTVFLNGFNLLPFLPLDGGWIVHVLLFSRHHVLDTAFRFLAAVVLISSGFLGLRILMFIGVMMLIGLRAAYRVARVAAEIRESNIDTSSPDGQSIPVETADAIISRLDAATPLPIPDALRAQQTLQVFESVNARPPGVLGTLMLGGVHGASLVIAMIFVLYFSLVQQWGREALREAEAKAMQYDDHKLFDSHPIVTHVAMGESSSRLTNQQRITLDQTSVTD
jgi:Zn-dependent protease